MSEGKQARGASAGGGLRTILWLALAAAIALGIVLRVERARTALFFGDEWHTLAVSSLGFDELVATFDRFGTGIGMPLLTRACGALFGTGNLSARLPALLGGLATLLLTWWYGRRFLGSSVGPVATVFLALNGFSIFYSGFARSYTIVTALALCLAGAVASLLEKRRAGPWLVVVVLGLALLPYFHLTALASGLAIVGAGALVLVLEGARRRASALCLAMVVGVGLGLLLHVPAWDGLMDFIGRKSKQKYPGEFGFVDVTALFVGHRGLTYAWLAAFPVAVVLLLVQRRSAALPLLAAIAGPALAVLAVRPFGDAYAYARYAIAALPFLALLFAWALGWVVERSRAGSLVTPGLGLVLAGVAFVLGPFGISRVDDGVFTNSYTTFFPLPAFDQDYDGAPEVYRRIADDAEAERILELPHLIHRGILMYRSYHFIHGKQVRTGFLQRSPRTTPDGYPTLAAEDWSEGLDVDYVVLHLDAVREAERYWASIYGDEGEPWDESVRAYMTRLEQVARSEERPDQRIVLKISRVFGEPVQRDQDVIVWKR